MPRPQYVGYRATHCPKCGEELDDMGEVDEGYLQRECIACDLLFRKKKGARFKWRMGSMEDFLEEDIKNI